MRDRLTFLLLGLLLLLSLLNFREAFSRFWPFQADHVVREVAWAAGEAVAAGGTDLLLDRRFAVGTGGRLEVQTRHADVEIVPGREGEVHVEILLSGDDLEAARRFYTALRFTVEQEGEAVRIVTRPERRASEENDTGDAHILVRAYIPATFRTAAAIAHGDLTAGVLHGPMTLAATHGDLTTDRLSGPALSLRTTHGDLAARHLEGEAVHLAATHGDIGVEALHAGVFSARATHGDIDLPHTTGSAEVDSRHGDVVLGLAATAGSRIRSQHGDVRLHLPAGLAADVDLAAAHVGLAHGLRFEGMHQEGRATGRLNGGGPLLDARTSHGSIQVAAY